MNDGFVWPEIVLTLDNSGVAFASIRPLIGAFFDIFVSSLSSIDYVSVVSFNRISSATVQNNSITFVGRVKQFR